jgi:retinol dehydrogenase-12
VTAPDAGSSPAARDLEGFNFLITGSNTGIGRAAALAAAARGAHVILAARSEERTRPVLAAITAAEGPAAGRFVPLDLGDLASVRTAAADIRGSCDRLDVLLNNAGVAGGRGQTRDGFELAFGVNHLGHYLLTRLLLDRLARARHGRIVNVASQGHRGIQAIDFQALRQPTRTRTGLHEYGVSKLCNILFTRALASRFEGYSITSYAVHPGVVASDIWRRLPAPARVIGKLFMISSEEGAARVLHCATAGGLDSGRYYDNYQPRRPSRLADDEALRERLWSQSAEWVGLPA